MSGDASMKGDVDTQLRTVYDGRAMKTDRGHSCANRDSSSAALLHLYILWLVMPLVQNNP